ncbi:hypothetical protein [Mycobacterium shinjukuense]|nr:hypothetical protein [Mycobacterium shinjukuense]
MGDHVGHGKRAAAGGGELRPEVVRVFAGVVEVDEFISLASGPAH